MTIPRTYEEYHYVGGKIFYIDETSDEVVEFRDINGEILNNVKVGDTPYAYRVVNPGMSGRDKYYVYNDSLYGSCRWTYYENGAYVYNSLGTGTAIGTGKSNTALVMAADEGKYVTSNSNGSPTIWYRIKQMNDNVTAGCNDWFVPSRYEVEELRKAIGYKVITTSDDPVILPAGAVTGGTIAGTADGVAHYKDYQTTRTCYPSNTKFIDTYMWSSSEYSVQYAWSWSCDGQVWNYYSKYNTYSVFGVRAF